MTTINPEDRDYFWQRAEAELEQAQQAAGREAVRAHYELAERYLDLVAGAASAEELRAIVPKGPLEQ